MEIEFIAEIEAKKIGRCYTYYIKIPSDVVKAFGLDRHASYKGWKGRRYLVRLHPL